MAIFEKETANKVLLDDTEQLTCQIENWKTVNGHTEFVIKVHRGPFSDETWRISKRYNDFYKLHTYLQTSGIQLSLPPKKIIGNSDPEFINQRLRGLQVYLNTLLMNPILVSSLPARSFIDPANYCQPFSEIALQHVSLVLRGEVGWEVVNPFTEIGWRIRKHYYHLKLKSAPTIEFWGSWTDCGPDKYLDEKDLGHIFRALAALCHPYIYPIDMCISTEIGGLVVRRFSPNGTLRDFICNAKPKMSFLKKYGNPKGHKPLEIDKIALYGKQILDALKFLHERGIPYGHLHTGNVIIENDNAKLLDVENGILGVPSFYRPYFMQHRKINSLEAIDVYCFGHTLYEMTFGAPLHESNVENFPDCPPNLKSLLESILSFEACKSGLPTIESLSNHAFFRNTPYLVGTEKIQFKLPISVKDKLKLVKQQIEERLKDEQRMVRSQKRLVKVQEMMSSEEEKKKQRHVQRRKEKEKEKSRRQASLECAGADKNENNSGATSSASPSSRTSSQVPTPPPPPVAPPAPPIPPPAPPLSDALTNGNSGSKKVNNDERSALLGAICNFNKSNLRKTQNIA